MYNAFRAPVVALVLAEFALAALAGLGAQKILDSRAAAPRALLIGAGGLVLLAALATALNEPLFAWLRLLYTTVPSLNSTEQQMLDLARFQLMLRDLWMIVFLLGSAAMLTWGFLRAWIGKPVFAALLIALVIVDLWQVESALNHPQPLAVLKEAPATDEVARLLRSESDLSRILPLEHLFSDNRWAGYGIFSAGGYHGAKLRLYQNFLDRLGLPNAVNLRALALLNVRWVLSPKPLNTPGLESAGRATLIYNGDPADVVIYRNANAMPRAWLVGAYRLVKDDAAALAAVQADDFDPARQAVLTAPPPLEPSPGADGSVIVENYRLHEITLRVQTDTPRLLVLSEIYYPQGWQATVDGVAVPILQADYVLRAVALTAGDHQIVFRFDPWDVRVGLVISIAAAVLIVLGFVVRLR
jgi:hypothetical protein